ncbi:hypothetical protein FOA52_011527 [Chlamydomonas sp. UWO 241]|nr:hypothetical protein FOA52_011527 [Chlamydomonas sp. UWO 241]
MAEKAGAIFRAYDVDGSGHLEWADSVAALAELAVQNGLAAAEIDSVLSQVDNGSGAPAVPRASFSRPRLSFGDFLSLADKLVVQHSLVAREGRIAAASRVSNLPAGAEADPALRQVFCAYCLFTRGISRMAMSESSAPAMVHQQLHKLGSDLGLVGGPGRPLTTAALDIAAARVRPPGSSSSRRLSFPQWLKVLCILSDESGWDLFSMSAELSTKLGTKPFPPPADAATLRMLPMPSPPRPGALPGVHASRAAWATSQLQQHRLSGGTNGASAGASSASPNQGRRASMPDARVNSSSPGGGSLPPLPGRPARAGSDEPTSAKHPDLIAPGVVSGNGNHSGFVSPSGKRISDPNQGSARQGAGGAPPRPPPHGASSAPSHFSPGWDTLWEERLEGASRPVSGAVAPPLLASLPPRKLPQNLPIARSLAGVLEAEGAQPPWLSALLDRIKDLEGRVPGVGASSTAERGRDLAPWMVPEGRLGAAARPSASAANHELDASIADAESLAARLGALEADLGTLRAAPVSEKQLAIVSSQLALTIAPKAKEAAAAAIAPMEARVAAAEEAVRSAASRSDVAQAQAQLLALEATVRAMRRSSSADGGGSIHGGPGGSRCALEPRVAACERQLGELSSAVTAVADDAASAHILAGAANLGLGRVEANSARLDALEAAVAAEAGAREAALAAGAGARKAAQLAVEAGTRDSAERAAAACARLDALEAAVTAEAGARRTAAAAAAAAVEDAERRTAQAEAAALVAQQSARAAEARLASLEAAVESLVSAGAAAAPAAAATEAQREGDTRSSQQTAQGAVGASAAGASLDDRVAALHAALAESAAREEGLAEAVTGLAARLAAQEDATAALSATTSALSATSNSLTATTSALSATSNGAADKAGAAATSAAAAGARLEVAEEQLAAVGGAFAALQARLDAADVQQAELLAASTSAAAATQPERATDAVCVEVSAQLAGAHDAIAREVDAQMGAQGAALAALAHDTSGQMEHLRAVVDRALAVVQAQAQAASQAEEARIADAGADTAGGSGAAHGDSQPAASGPSLATRLCDVESLVARLALELAAVATPLVAHLHAAGPPSLEASEPGGGGWGGSTAGSVRSSVRSLRAGGGPGASGPESAPLNDRFSAVDAEIEELALGLGETAARVHEVEAGLLRELARYAKVVDLKESENHLLDRHLQLHDEIATLKANVYTLNENLTKVTIAAAVADPSNATRLPGFQSSKSVKLRVGGGRSEGGAGAGSGAALEALTDGLHEVSTQLEGVDGRLRAVEGAATAAQEYQRVCVDVVDALARRVAAVEGVATAARESQGLGVVVRDVVDALTRRVSTVEGLVPPGVGTRIEAQEMVVMRIARQVDQLQSRLAMAVAT